MIKVDAGIDIDAVTIDITGAKELLATFRLTTMATVELEIDTRIRMSRPF